MPTHRALNILRSVAAALLLCLAAAGPATAQSEPVMAAQAQRLEQTRNALEQLESTLSKPDLPESLLKSLRERIDPILATINGVIEQAQPRADGPALTPA